jgi:phenylalanyl-tRNA synthetase beta chain
MKFSVNWLREFVELPAGVDELAELLTLAGIEIEGIETRGANFANVVVAQIIASSQHPNADRLTVCTVDDGSGEPRQIVCGAKNYKVGDKVPLAMPGAVLANDLKIGVNKLRGVESQGMLCSGKELALSDDAAGLLILPNESKIGAPIGTLFPDDTIFDVEITPNRGDLLSHYGLAREIAALRNVAAAVTGGRSASATGRSASATEAATTGRLPPETAAATTIQIHAPNECPFYSGRRIENVTVGPSPPWLRAKIEAVGIRSINNIVDISNFVMLELGQPTHAFDADKLRGSINVRLANEGEKFLALDGKTYSLAGHDLLIADSERAVGIGGVMGGEETGVTESTRNVLLEAAYFLPASVRRTARNLGLPSDASYRFERGVDPEMILRASARAADLMRDVAGGKPDEKVAIAGKIPARVPDVSLNYKTCDQLLGIAIAPKTVDAILKRFGLEKKSKSKSTRLRSATARQASKSAAESTWKIPSYRRDLRREVDLIEEVIRGYGVDKVSGVDRSRFTPASEADRVYDTEAAMRERLVARGISEVRTSSLIPRRSAGGSFVENALEVRNPRSEDHVALRPSLLPGLLAVAGRNIRAGAASIKLFELGRIFQPANGNEEPHLALLFAGKIEETPNWRGLTKRRLDFFDVKGAVESITRVKLSFRRTSHPDFALGSEIFLADKVIGRTGQLALRHVSELRTDDPVFVAELNLDLVASEQKGTFRELEKFPAVTRDIAMIVPESTSHDEIVAVIESAKEPLLERVELFDLFSGKQAENFGAARKSLAYSLTYRDRNRTLTNDEVTVVHARIRERLQRELAAELRE